MISFKEFKEEIKALLNAYVEIAGKAKEASKEKKLQSMEPYATVPGEEDLTRLTPEDKERFDEDIKPIKEKGIILISEKINAVNSAISEPPTQEAVNYVSMLKLKGNSITEDDINVALSHYGNNYITYEAIKSIAQENDIYVGDTPLKSIKDSLENIERTFLRMSGNEADSMTAGNMAFQISMMFNTFPDEL